MDSKILNYSTWKKKASAAQLNEGLFWDVTETEPIKGTKHKVKVKYLDANSFKVKAVNDVDMVTAAGDITPGLIDGMIDFLKSHDRTNFEREYPALADPISFFKDHFFTYNVLRENDRRQVVVFSIQKRANFKGVPPATKILSDTAAADLSQSPEANALLAKSGQSIIQKTPDETAQTPKTPAGAFKEIQLADLKNLTKASPFFKTFDDAVAVLAKSGLFTTDARAAGLIDAVIVELEKGQLGKNSELLIKGLMAGLGMSTYVDKYGKTKARTSITQEVYDKLVAMVPTAQNSSRQYYLGLDGRAILEAEEQTFSLPADFNMDLFLMAISQVETPTITEVIKRSAVAGTEDQRVKEFQQLVIDKFAKHPTIGQSDLYKKFAKYKADGDYGPTTDAMVAWLKLGFHTSDEKDTSRGNTITPELVKKINAENVSESVYLDLNSRIVEQFDIDAANASMKTYKPAGGGGASGGGSSASGSTKKVAAKDLPEALKCLSELGGELVDNSKRKAMKFKSLRPDRPFLYLYDSGNLLYGTEESFKSNFQSKETVPNGIHYKWNCSTAKDLIAAKDVNAVLKITKDINSAAFSGKLDEDKRKALAKTIQTAIESAGFDSYLIEDVESTDDGVKWSYKYKNNPDASAKYKIDTAGKFEAVIKYTKGYMEMDKTITGNLTSDSKQIKLSNGRTIPLKEAIRIEIDIDMKKLSSINHVKIASKLFNAMNGAGTYRSDVYNALNDMSTYADWYEVDTQINVVDDEENLGLRSWIKSEFGNTDMGEYVIDGLIQADCIPTFVYDDYTTQMSQNYLGMYDAAWGYAKTVLGQDAKAYAGDGPYIGK